MIWRFLAWLLFAVLVLAAVVYGAAHYPFLFGVPFLVFVFAVLFYRAVLGRSAQVRRRVRALRWRARLRLRPGPGYASLFELVFRWGRLAALRARPPGPARPQLRGPPGFAHHRLRRPARPRAVWPPRLCAHGRPDSRTGTPAHRQDRVDCRPDPQPSGPGAGHQHAPRPAQHHCGRPGPPRTDQCLEPAGRRRPAEHLRLVHPRRLPRPGHGSPHSRMAGRRHPASLIRERETSSGLRKRAMSP